MMMKVGNKAGAKIIKTHGYSFFCAFRSYRHAGYGISVALHQAAVRNAIPADWLNA